jgi:hypothetical protein
MYVLNDNRSTILTLFITILQQADRSGVEDFPQLQHNLYQVARVQTSAVRYH